MATCCQLIYMMSFNNMNDLHDYVELTSFRLSQESKK